MTRELDGDILIHSRSRELEDCGELERALFLVILSIACGVRQPAEPIGVANSFPSKEKAELRFWETDVGVPV